jgi:hypothetical protein
MNAFFYVYPLTRGIEFGNTSAAMGQQLRTRVKRKARDRRKKRLKERAKAKKTAQV